MSGFTNSDINLSTVDVTVMKEDIFVIYEQLAQIIGDEPQFVEGTTTYLFHNMEFSKNSKEECEIRDCSQQKVIGEIELEGNEHVTLTHYIPINNKYILWLVLDKLHNLYEQLYPDYEPV